MVYHSLFDQIRDGKETLDDTHFRESLGKALAFEGSLESVLSQLEEALLDPHPDYRCLLTRVLHSPRVIRAVLNYKIDHPATRSVPRLVNVAVHLCRAVYKGKTTPNIIKRFSDFLYSTGSEAVLGKDVIQTVDQTSWTATSPQKSARTAADLVARLFVRPILFIPLAHGAIPAGIDVYLRYVSSTGAEDSIYYPVRFSRRKCGDRQLLLLPNEIQYLKRKASGRQVILFQEDEYSGETMRQARAYFFSIIPQHCILSVCNYIADSDFI